jgi:tetratricopeptide (TPR) repeat protein
MRQGQIPKQLPANVRTFTGRDAELASLDALLGAPEPAGPGSLPPAGPGELVVCGVTGPGGVGKTALVVRWAHRIRDQFPDGQLYVNLRGYDPAQPVSADVALAGMLQALEANPDIPVGLEARAAAYRTALDGRRVLVVLDNATSAAQVRPLLPGSPEAVTVITSRDQLTPLAAEGARILPLDPLAPAESHALLARRLGPGRVAGEPAAAQQITDACAGLPLALVVVAARAANTPAFALSVLADELAETGRRLDVMTAGDALSDVRAVFSWSYQELPPLAARAWRQLSLHPGPDLTVPAAASLTGVPLAAVRPLLATLTSANLITEHQPGRYVFHDLLREYATEQALHSDAAPQRQAAVRRLLDYYVHTAHAAARQLYARAQPIPLPLSRPAPGGAAEVFSDIDQARAWLNAERQVLLSAQRLAVDTGQDALAWQLAWGLTGILDREGYHYDRIFAWQTALSAAVRLGEQVAQALAHRSLGYALTVVGADAGEVDRHLDSSLQLYIAAGDTIGAGEAHRAMLYAWIERGQHDRALDHAHQALTCFEAAGYSFGQAGTTGDIGWTLALLGRYSEALTWAQRALALQQEPRDDLSAAHTSDTIGYIHYKLGDYGLAEDSYRQSLRLFRAAGAGRSTEASTLAGLGDVLLARGQRAAAAAAWQQALGLFTEADEQEAASVKARLGQLEAGPD